MTSPSPPCQQISTSRVNDGVCDCCDGSDEHSPTHCVDSCAHDAAAFRQSALATLATTQHGFAARQRALDTKVRAYFDDASQAALAAAQTLDALKQLQTRVAALTAREERKETALRLRLARTAAHTQDADDITERVTAACVGDDTGSETCDDQQRSNAVDDDADAFAAIDARDVDTEAAPLTDDADYPTLAEHTDEPEDVARVKAQVELSDGTRVSLSEYLRMESEAEHRTKRCVREPASERTREWSRWLTWHVSGSTIVGLVGVWGCRFL